MKPMPLEQLLQHAPPPQPPALMEILAGQDHAEARKLLPPRPDSATKHEFGSALIIAGSAQYPGAAILAARAAVRSGAGYVRVAAPSAAAAALSAAVPEAIVHTLGNDHLKQDGNAPHAHMERAHAVLIGPGIGTDPETAAMLESTLHQHQQRTDAAPVILDADALNWMAAHQPDLKALSGKLIITPHAGEMARLMQTERAAVLENGSATAADAARRHGAIAVLKGPGTIITNGAQARISPWQTSALAKAGSGDVLAGLMAGLLAQMPHSPMDAAALAVYLHGFAGAAAAEDKSAYAAAPSDIIDYLGDAFTALAKP